MGGDDVSYPLGKIFVYPCAICQGQIPLAIPTANDPLQDPIIGSLQVMGEHVLCWKHAPGILLTTMALFEFEEAWLEEQGVFMGGDLAVPLDNWYGF